MGRAIVITLGVLIVMLVISGLVAMVSDGVTTILTSWFLVVLCATWTAADASKIQTQKYQTDLSSPTVIFFGTLLLWIVVFPWYLVLRQRILDGNVPLKTPVVTRQSQTSSFGSSTTQPPVIHAPPPGLTSAALEQLEKLAILKDKGVLT